MLLRKSMKPQHIIKGIVVLLFAFGTSCSPEVKKTITEQPLDLEKNVSNIGEMKIADGFNFDMHTEVNASISIGPNPFGNLFYLVSIYDGNPNGEGALLSSGSARDGSPFTCKFSIPSYLRSVFVVRKAPDENSIMEEVPVVNGTIQKTFLGKTGDGIQKLGKTGVSSPDCNTGCTTSYQNQSNLNINNNSSNAVICIKGTFSGSINTSAGTIRICGTGSLQNLNVSGNATVIFTSGATVSLSNLNMNGGSSTVKNFSTALSLSGNLNVSGTYLNYGTLTVAGNLNTSGNSASFTNEGTITVSGNVDNNRPFTNSGVLTVTGNFTHQSNNSTFTNGCRLTVNGNMSVNRPLTNNEYIYCANNLTMNGSSSITMNGAAMMNVKNLTLNGTINGTGTTSFVKVRDNTTINGSGTISGNLYFCDSNGIETNNGTISSNVTQACTLYIPTSACNTAGNGTAPVPPVQIQDADNDGVADALDDYPSDATRAYNNYYPSSGTYATVAFEDLWPSKGDYDLNDLVVGLRHNAVTNASNQVVEFRCSYVLRANGGNQNLAFCVQFPALRNNIGTITGGGTLESGQTNAVLQLFNNSKTLLPNWNTRPELPPSDTVVYSITVPLVTPVAFSGVGAGAYDPFIWVNESGKGRGYEIHLPGKAPTALANTSVFGYADDGTNPSANKYYLSKNNLPWALLVPERWDYPKELSLISGQTKPDVTQVYLHFAQWAQSSNTIYTDWFQSGEGYKNSSYIYVRP